MSISRRSVIAGAAAGGALLALNAPAANARDRFVSAAVEPTIKKVPTPAVGHAIVKGSSKTSLSSIESVAISPWNNIIPGYGDYNLNGDSWGTSRVCISAFDSDGKPVTNAKPAGSEAVRGFYAEGRIYVPLIDPSQPAGHKELWNRTAVWESDARSENWTLRDIRDPKGQPYKAEHIWSLCSAPATNGTLFITISSHKDDVHGLSYEDGVILAGDFEEASSRFTSPPPRTRPSACWKPISSPLLVATSLSVQPATFVVVARKTLSSSLLSTHRSRRSSTTVCAATTSPTPQCTLTHTTSTTTGASVTPS